MKISREEIVVGRMLYEDEDHIAIEFGKREDVSFHLDPESPDKFYTVLFIHQDEGGAQIWVPWREAE